MGVDRVEVVRFDRRVQELTPEGFLDRVMGPEAPLRALVVGPDFRMGKDRVGNCAYLQSLGARRGFQVREVPLLTESGSRLSSTLLRKEIEGGRVEEAAKIMGRAYALEGMVGSGAGRGTGLGYPTANLELGPQKLLPAPGIYLSMNHLEGSTHPGITYVGSAGTFGPGPVRVEVHLFDFNGSLRGKSLKTLLIERMRTDQVFGSSEELIRAMDDDLARARTRWSEIGSGEANAEA
jgi:riboflavin kinase/FMN adenylyltransferase